VIDLTTEQTISLPQAAALLPPGRRGARVHLSCVLRWILDGAVGPDGARVKLDGLRVGGRWITSREALQRFAEALTPGQTAKSGAPSRAPTTRERANTRAAKRLEAIGI